MKARAAVAFQASKQLEVAEVELDGRRAGEVLVEVKATGICHTDASTLSGAGPERLLQPFSAMRRLAAWSMSGRTVGEF
jgi:S-(hydroxymethyl)glutathione dehydrogenase / alcohol dehydrogenase